MVQIYKKFINLHRQ